MNQQGAEIIAISALQWLVSQQETLSVFMGASGAGADDLRNGATQPAFLGAILDFILMDDTMVLEFSSFANIAPDQPYRARQMLPGGDIPNWT